MKNEYIYIYIYISPPPQKKTPPLKEPQKEDVKVRDPEV
jgi:hypothetical protein